MVLPVPFNTWSELGRGTPSFGGEQKGAEAVEFLKLKRDELEADLPLLDPSDNSFLDAKRIYLIWEANGEVEKCTFLQALA